MQKKRRYGQFFQHWNEPINGVQTNTATHISTGHSLFDMYYMLQANSVWEKQMIILQHMSLFVQQIQYSVRKTELSWVMQASIEKLKAMNKKSRQNMQYNAKDFNKFQKRTHT